MGQSNSEDAEQASVVSRLQQLWNNQKENFWTIAIALILAFSVKAWIAESRYIPSVSMVPTLYPGDRIVVEKLTYDFHGPKPGDIIVFRPPDSLQAIGYGADQAFIKRVIAIPGQTVAVHHGKVLVDASPLDEPYIYESPHYEMPEVTVPEGSLFVMGDNRNNSNDSHIWGFLPTHNVIGRANFRFWPPGTVGQLQDPILPTRIVAK